MFKILFSNDKNVLSPLYLALFPSNAISGVNYILLDNDKAVGVCRLELSDVVEIADFAVLEEYDAFEIKDFFFRAVLFKLSFNPYLVKVAKYDIRLEKFGFIKDNDGGMSVMSAQIVFPKCKNE